MENNFLRELVSDNVSNAIGLVTPIILFLWFYYSQKQVLSKNYFDEIDGIYAGFTDTSNSNIINEFQSGIIMNIRDTDNKGYFKGELDYAKTKMEIIDGRQSTRKIHDGVYTFMGKLDFKIFRNKARHPFELKQNRKYAGTLYIVDRLDFDFENYKIEDYLSAEYDILHYREMQTLKFTLRIIHKETGSSLPKSFILYRKMGASFEPYNNVKDSVFMGNTRCDI